MSALTSLPVDTALKVLKDVAESLEHVPYVRAIAHVAVKIIDIREQVKDNKDQTDHLVDRVAERTTALLRVLQQMKENGGMRLEDLKYDLERYERLLLDIHDGLQTLVSDRIAAVSNRDAVKRRLQEYSTRLTEYDSIFNFSRLTNIEMIVRRIDARAESTKPGHAPKAATVPPPSKTFSGRKEVLTKLGQYFSSSATSGEQRVYVLYGLGGAGKTQIGLKFIKEQAKWFSRMYFINASTLESITTAFENIAADAQLPELTVAATLQWLSSLKEEWLLFFDNADNPSIDLYSYFPPCAHGNILITSRNPEMHQHAPHSYSHVDRLSPDEALELLQHSSMLEVNSINKEHANLLVQELGCLALAVVQAGAYIAKSKGVSFQQYREMYKLRRGDLLQRKAGQNMSGYEWTVYTSWDITFQKLSKLAARLLQLLSFWHYDNIPKAAFQNAIRPRPNLPDGWKDAVEFMQNFATSGGEWDDFAFQEVINELTSYSLLSSDMDGIFSMHPLVHSWARDRSNAIDRQQSNLCAGHLLGLSIRGDDETSPGVPFWRLIFAHVQLWIINQPEWSASEDLDLAIEFARVYNGKGWWKDAEMLYEDVLNAHRKDLGEEHPTTLSSMTNLASTYSNQGRWNEAAELHEVVLDKRRRILGEEHRTTLVSKSHLAWTYSQQGRWKEAEELQNAVLEAYRGILGEDDPATLSSMSNLASTYANQGRWKEAEALHTAAHESKRKMLGEEHPRTLTSMAQLAWTYSNQGRWKEAEDLQVVVVEKQKKVLGEEHPYTLNAMASLAWTYSNRGKWVEAKELQTVVVEKRRKVLGEEHPKTAQSIRSLVYYQKH